MHRRTFLGSLGAGAAALAASTAPLAQPAAWPDGAIRIVTPTPVGVGIDAIARVYAEHLGRALKVPVVVENRPGAGGMLGTDAVAKSAPTGQTLLMATGSTFTTTPQLFAKVPYDPKKDLVPVAQLYRGGSFLVARPTLAANSVAELATLARQRPRAINYASHGPGSTAHMFMEQLQDTAGMELQHIPYRQSFVPDLIAGQVDIGWEPPNSALPMVRSGKLKALAYSGEKRSTALPDVPALSEAFPGLEFTVWVGMWAPAGTPDAVVRRLHATLLGVTADPAVARVIADAGAEPMATPQANIAAAIDAESLATLRLIRAKNLRVD